MRRNRATVFDFNDNWSKRALKAEEFAYDAELDLRIASEEKEKQEVDEN